MSEFSDTSKKVVAGALAGTVAVVGGVGLSQQAKKDQPQNSTTVTSMTQEYSGAMPTSNEYNVGGKTFIVSETSGIFASVTEMPETSLTSAPKTTESLEKRLEKRRISPSQFSSEEELYKYYEEVWQNKNNGKSALEYINEAHVIDDNEFKVAIALAYLKEKNIDPLEIHQQLKVIQVCCLFGSEIIEENIFNDMKPLLELFPEEFLMDESNIYKIIKIYLPLANEFTALKDVREKGIYAVTFNISSLTPEIAMLASNYNITIMDEVITFLEEKNGIEITLNHSQPVRK